VVLYLFEVFGLVMRSAFNLVNYTNFGGTLLPGFQFVQPEVASSRFSRIFSNTVLHSLTFSALKT
jgi:hypothetical protein